MDNEQAPETGAKSAQEKMLRGSAWMTIGSVFSRVLGAIYILPWYAWMGADRYTANALFTKGYQLYAIFIIISTAGIPGAVSKQIARYDAMGEYNTSMRLFWHGMLATTGMGIVSASLMWFGAPILAAGDARMIPVFHSLSAALVIIPILSVMRGFFQGHSDMAPSAISQFIEQLVRVIYMLTLTYAIMKVGNGNYVDAVVHSTFAAFIGAAAGIALLVFIFVKRLPALRQRNAKSKNEIQISVNQLLLEIVFQAAPIILMDSAISWYYVIDQYTFFNGMKSLYVTSTSQLNVFYAMFAGNANKLIMIVVSLATAMAVTAIPLLSGAFTRKDHKNISKQITSIIQLFFMVMLPAAIGMAAIARPLYVLFYDYSPVGFSMLEVSCVLAIFLGFFTVLAALLQGLFKNMLAIKLMLFGTATKVILQLPFMYLFNVYGPMFATLAGMMVSCAFMVWELRRRFHFKARQTWHRVMGMVIFAILMFIAVRLTVTGLSLILNPQSKVQSLMIIVGALIVGVAVYGYLVLTTRLADKVMGARVAGIRRRLRMK